MMKTNDADVVLGRTDVLGNGTASSVLLVVTSLTIDLVEEANGSKADNVEGHKISVVESSIARESSSRGLALNSCFQRG